MRRLWITRILASLIVVLMIFSLTACFDKEKNQTLSESNEDEELKKTELEFITLDWYLPAKPRPDCQMVNDAINEYLKEKVNAHLIIHYWDPAEYKERVSTMVISGQDMGILCFGSGLGLDYSIHSKLGSLYPLDELLDKYGAETKELFPSEIWDAIRVNGSIYGIPSLKDNCYIMSFIYNADMAEALELDMESVKFTNWRQIEPFLNEVLKKRSEVFPEYDKYPLCRGKGEPFPYCFAIETFLSDNLVAVCNIDPFFEVAGYDDNTVFNFYATDEYRDFVKMRQRMVENNIFAYDEYGKYEWDSSGALFAWPGWGYARISDHLYGDTFTTKMIVSDRIWTDTYGYLLAGTSISSKCANPERAMMILNLVNTDPGLATMLRFGIKGKHYIINDEGKMQFEGSERNNSSNTAEYGYFYWYMADAGNLLIVNAPESLVGPDGIMLKELERYNKEAVVPRHMGFVVDIDPIANEIAACANVIAEYHPVLTAGQLSSQEEVDKIIDEFVAKLNANGAEKIVAEVQRQIDEWNAKRK